MRTISFMTNNYFDTFIQEPSSPEREIRISAPPKLRRGDYTRPHTDNKEILLRNYMIAKTEITKLNSEIIELRYSLGRCQTLLKNVQEILFENSEKIPEGVYIQLMDSLVKI